MRSTQTLFLLLFMLLVFLVGAAFHQITDSWVIDPDSAAYVGLAKAMLQGEGYSFSGIPHTKYPPFFPVLLAFTGWLVGADQYEWMQYVVALFWLVSLVITYLLFSSCCLKDSAFTRQGMPKSAFTGLVFALIMASSIYMLQYATVFLRTECIFTALSLAALAVAIKIQQEKTPTYGRLILFALLFLCAYLTRMAGIALVGALVLAFVLDKNMWVRKEGRWGQAVVLILICAIGPSLWMWRNHQVSVEGSTDYASEFTQRYGLDLTKNHDLEMERITTLGMVKRMAGNGEVFCESCAKMALNSSKGGAKAPLRFGFGMLCLFGLMVCLVRRRSVVDYYCLLYLLLYLVWPFNQQQRFYLPIFPFLMEYMAVTLLLLNRLLPRILRNKGAWFLFFGLQVPLLATLISSRSQQVEIFGRWSYQYLAFAVTVTAILVIADVYLLMERARPGGMKWILKTMRVCLPALYLCGFVGLGLQSLLIQFPERHNEFVMERKAHPVPESLEKIEVQTEFIHLVQWIMENTDEDDVIMCDVPKMIHILTGRRTVPFTFHGKQETLARHVNGTEPAYVYYSGEIPWVYRVFKQACQSHEKVFSRSYDVGGGLIMEPALYRILPPAE